MSESAVEIENTAELDALKRELSEEPGNFATESESEQAQKPTGEFIGTESCAGLCLSMFDVLASRKGEAWKLKEDEAAQLGSALDRVLAKYIPAGLDKYSDETALLVISLGIVLPRLNAESSAGVEHGTP